MARRNQRHHERTYQQKAVRSEAPPDGHKVEPERFGVREGVDRASHRLFEQKVVDVLGAAFEPHASEPNRGETGDDAPGFESKILTESFPVPFHGEEHGYRQRRHQQTDRPFGEQR